MGQVIISLFLLTFQSVRGILEGYAIGLAMSIFIGPVLFTLIQSTIRYGVKAGFAVAFGIFISDVVIVALCLFGTLEFFENAQYQSWLALAGSAILFFIGFKYILKPTVNTISDFKPSVFSLYAFFVKGFLVNFINPFVFMVWISTITFAKIKFGSGNSILYFLIAVLLGILTTDSFKVILSGRIQRFLTPAVLRKISFIIGVILICFGIRFVYFAFIQ